MDSFQSREIADAKKEKRSRQAAVEGAESIAAAALKKKVEEVLPGLAELKKPAEAEKSGCRAAQVLLLYESAAEELQPTAAGKAAFRQWRL